MLTRLYFPRTSAAIVHLWHRHKNQEEKQRWLALLLFWWLSSGRGAAQPWRLRALVAMVHALTVIHAGPVSLLINPCVVRPIRAQPVAPRISAAYIRSLTVIRRLSHRVKQQHLSYIFRLEERGASPNLVRGCANAVRHCEIGMPHSKKYKVMY